jgi:hypothetical protein
MQRVGALHSRLMDAQDGAPLPGTELVNAIDATASGKEFFLQ